MNIIVEHINYNEALRYLGAGGKEISPEMDALLKSAEKELLEVANPKVTYKIEKNEIIFAATLGVGVDRLIVKKQINDMATAVMIDGLASAMTEQVLDEFEKKLAAKINKDIQDGEMARAKGDSLTNVKSERPKKVLGPRFSPGYGDFPLEAQKDILQHLNAEKLIGLTLTSGGMLSPIKSVTGIIRIYSGEESFSTNLDGHSGCENCKMKDGCKFRKNNDNANNATKSDAADNKEAGHDNT